MIKSVILLLIVMVSSIAAEAANPPGKGPSLLEAVNHMRLRQEGEENNSIRVIQPASMQLEEACSPVQQSRQRIRDLVKAEGPSGGSVSVEAGHGEINVDNNSGTVNSSVNVQIVNPNERNCL
jgi:hypothetical protein